MSLREVILRNIEETCEGFFVDTDEEGYMTRSYLDQFTDAQLEIIATIAEQAAWTERRKHF